MAEPVIPWSPTSQAQPAEVSVVESGLAEDDDLLPDEVEEITKARFPLFRNPRKGEYLSNRACGFGVRESCHLAGVNHATLTRWRREDPEFVQWENDRLRFLQTQLAGDVLRAEFMRNFRLILRRDFRVIYKAVYNFDGLTKREWAYLMKIRKEYGPQALLALDRATEPEPEADPEKARQVNIRDSVIINVEGQQVESIEARQAAAAALLEQFQRTRNFAQENNLLEAPSGNGSTE